MERLSVKKVFHILSFLVISTLFSCSGLEKTEYDKLRRKNCKGEYITRRQQEYFSPIASPKLREREPYPWEDAESSDLPKITREHFRCKGKKGNPPHIDEHETSKPQLLQDCEASQHGLPFIGGKEDVYPVLIELLNYLQKKTKKKVVITCGHRCPLHNNYADSSAYNKTSKHTLGAEVDFFIQGMEDKPLEVVKLLTQFYKETSRYQGQAEFETFHRYEKEDTNVSQKPWYNKEIFVKVFQEKEGRDFDNKHPFPYISVQVRFDREKGERVVYTWEKANKGYLK